MTKGKIHVDALVRVKPQFTNYPNNIYLVSELYTDIKTCMITLIKNNKPTNTTYYVKYDMVDLYKGV